MTDILIPIAEYEHKRRPASSRWLSARDLDAMTFPEIKYVVPGWIVEGLTLLAGAPKLGKSWLAFEMGLAVASGGCCLGEIQCEQGDVLYLALEDNRRRLQSRLRKLWQMEKLARIEAPARLHLATEWPRAGEGVKAIRDWITDHPEARLVIVDVLAMFKAISKGRDQTLYEGDYQSIKELQGLAMETGVAIVVVTHTRKSPADNDPFEKVSGTLGLSGAADSTVILDRDGHGCTAYGRGRDLDEFEVAMTFDRATCRWRALGNAPDVRRTDERSSILDALADAGEPMSPAEIAAATGMPPNNIRQLLFKMTKAGEVAKASRGRYRHPHLSDPDNNGNEITAGETS